MIRRQRVVHVTLGLEVGGQEKLLVEFARHADRRRFELHFVSLGGRGALAPALESLGWPVTTLNEPVGLRPGLALRLAKVFRDLRADVVHTHDDKPLIYGGPAVRLARVRRFIHTHHHGRLAQVTARQDKLLLLAARFPRHVVCVSEDSRLWLRDLGVADQKLLTIRNGIDLELFPFQGSNDRGPAVCVARLSGEKDLANLLRAVAILAPTMPEFRLEIAGDGPLREELIQLRDALTLTEQVSFLGTVANIPALLARARLFVLPSQTEGISLTLLEAMASGLPVVATRVGGNPEVVAEGTTGLLAPPGDPASLAAHLESLWRDSSRSQAMGSRGRERVERQFDIRAMVARYEALIRYPWMQVPELETVSSCMS